MASGPRVRAWGLKTWGPEDLEVCGPKGLGEMPEILSNWGLGPE